MSNNLNYSAELDAEESLARQGELYVIGGEVNLAAGASHKIGLRSTKNLTFLHSRFRSNSVKVRAYLYEANAFTGGTVGAPFNRNRVSSLVSSTVVTRGVTATVANPVAFALFGSQPGPSDVDEPLILRKNTDYVLEFVNDAQSQTDDVFYSISCCELDL